MKNHFSPRDKQEHERAKRGSGEPDICWNCHRPFMSHTNGRCPRDAYPQWWIMRPCRHWDVAKNRRFRFVRLDGPTDHGGVYPCHSFDGDTHAIERQPYGIKGHELLREARPEEVPVDLFTMEQRPCS